MTSFQQWSSKSLAIRLLPAHVARVSPTRRCCKIPAVSSDPFWARLSIERTALPATAAAGQTPPGAKPNRDGAEPVRRASDGQLRDQCPDLAVRVGCSRRRAIGVPEEWSSRGGFARRLTKPGLQAG